MSINLNTAVYLKSTLLSIYKCKVPFELLVIDKKPKTRMGVYIPVKKRIRVYSKWSIATPLMEIAIHEYAHHIHCTEQKKAENNERPHGPQFWEIYGALMCVAVQKGYFKEDRIFYIATH